MATIQSLVEDGTFVIDETVYIHTGDKFRYNGHYYSDKPPILALAASPIYLLLHLAGFTFENNPGLVYYLITLLTMGILSALTLVVFRKILVGYFEVPVVWADMVTLLTGAGTLIWVYTSVFNNHIAAGCLLMAGFYFFLQYRHRLEMKSVIFLSIVLTLAGSIDFTCFLFLPTAFFVVLIWSRKAGLIFSITAIPVFAIYLLLNYHISGSILPPPLNESLWTYQDSRFSSDNLSGLSGHQGPLELSRYAFHMIAGSRGLFTLSPILLFSVAGTARLCRRKMIAKYRSGLLLFLILCLVYIGLYIFRSVNYSGYAFGIRWYVSIMPLLCLPLAFIDEWFYSGTLRRIVFMATAILSMMVALLGFYAPFTPGTGFDFVEGTIIQHEGIIRPGLLFTTTSVIWRIKFLVLSGILFFLLYWSYRRLVSDPGNK
jgi:hypothetical protein